MNIILSNSLLPPLYAHRDSLVRVYHNESNDTSTMSSRKPAFFKYTQLSSFSSKKQEDQDKHDFINPSNSNNEENPNLMTLLSEINPPPGSKRSSLNHIQNPPPALEDLNLNSSKASVKNMPTPTGTQPKSSTKSVDLVNFPKIQEGRMNSLSGRPLNLTDPVEISLYLSKVHTEKAEILKNYMNYLETVDKKLALSKEEFQAKLERPSKSKEKLKKVTHAELQVQTKLKKPTQLFSIKDATPKSAISHVIKSPSSTKLAELASDNKPKLMTENQLDETIHHSHAAAPHHNSVGPLNVSSTYHHNHNPTHTHSHGHHNTGIHAHHPVAIDEEFSKDLAFNLRMLALNNLNEKHTAGAIEKLSNKNPKIIEFVSPKNHKIQEYDLAKLEKKFKSVEVFTNDHSNNLLMRSQMKKTGDGSIIDQNTLKHLKEFQSNLEEHNIQKKHEALRNMEDYLIKIGNKIKDDEARLQKLVRQHHMKEVDVKVGKIVDPRYFAHFEIVNSLEHFEKQNGEFKLVKRRNIAHAKSLKELVNKWVVGTNLKR